jgi:hypothetical protein
MDEREQPYSGPTVDPDPEWAEYVAWLDGEIAAGRDPDRQWQPAQGSLRFGQGDEADMLPPGPLLVGLTEEAAEDFGSLSDSELAGVLQAARRQEIREGYKQTLAVAEFARRREAAFENAKARGVPTGCRPGGFPGEELAIELVITRIQASHRIETATDLVTRLPATLAGMGAGLIDEARAYWIAFYTRCLTPADAARADEILAAAAPDLRVDQLVRKAAALEMRLDPAAAKARKDHEKRTNQRVEARREASGNASLSAREMDTADAIAAKSYIDAIAVALRNGGLDAPLGSLRVLAMGDLTQGRNPLDRLNPPPAEPGRCPADPESGVEPEPGPGTDPEPSPGTDPEPDGGPSVSSFGRAGPVPAPALINLIVPSGVLLGWSTGPAQAGSWGLLDHEETRTIAAAASRHQRTRWCVTVTNDKGEAVAHACARGQHPWSPEGAPDPKNGAAWRDDDPAPRQPHGPPRQRDDPRGRPDDPAGQRDDPPGYRSDPRAPRDDPPPPRDDPPPPRDDPPPPRDDPPPQRHDPCPQRDGPTPAQAARLRELLRRLNLVFEPVARGTCDHGHAEDHYTPSRKLRHLVRARTATCDAPGCGAQACYADLDHTVPYPGGPTDECNLAPRCRTHHRTKQAPDWKVEQVEPGVSRWTLPSGRTRLTTPTRYDL